MQDDRHGTGCLGAYILVESIVGYMGKSSRKDEKIS